MAIGDTYATLGELKSYMSLTGQTGLDEQMTDALQSASREIERYTKRHFNRAATGVVSTKVYRPHTSGVLWVHDFLTATGLVVETDDDDDGTYETVWAATDFQAEPLNPEDGFPYTKIRAVGIVRWFPFCKHRAAVRVTAEWGWAGVPAPVKQACLLLAAENFQLKDAPLGVAGMGEFGVIRVRNNQMAAAKLALYSRNRVANA